MREAVVEKQQTGFHRPYCAESEHLESKRHLASIDSLLNLRGRERGRDLRRHVIASIYGNFVDAPGECGVVELLK